MIQTETTKAKILLVEVPNGTIDFGYGEKQNILLHIAIDAALEVAANEGKVFNPTYLDVFEMRKDSIRGIEISPKSITSLINHPNLKV